MNLFVNQLLEWKSSNGECWIERILWINPNGSELVTIRVNDPHALPIMHQRLEVEAALETLAAHSLDQDPYSGAKPTEENIPGSHKQVRDNAWAAIASAVEDPTGRIFHSKGRGALMNTLEKQTGRTRMTLYKFLRRYWQGGQTKNALLPFFHQCGGKGKERKAPGPKRGRPNKLSIQTGTPVGINITEEIRQKIGQGIRQFYETGERHSLAQAYQLTLENLFHKGYELQDGVLVKILLPANELPSYTQFRYWYEKEKDPTRSLTKRMGKRAFQLRHRAVLGESTSMAFGPGSVYQIDSTIADVYLVSSIDRKRIIGRPVLYTVIDVFSRLIAGVHVSLEGPSWNSARLALENAFIKKESFCREYGISVLEETWPCRHIPETILADRSELLGKNSDSLVNALGVHVMNTPPYRADWKGIVERNFRVSNDTLIHWLPGAVHRQEEPGGRDTRLDATLDLHQFRKLMILSILDHNQHHRMDWYRLDEQMIQDGVEPYPIELWNWGIEHRTGHLKVMPSEVIRQALLPSAEASVTPRGIRFQGLVYTCEVAVHEQWFVRARLKGSWKVPIVYDPRRMDRLYLRLGSDQGFVPCALLETDQMFQGRDWHEVADYFEMRKQAQERAKTEQQQAKATFHAHMEDILNEARQQTAQAVQGPRKPARLRGMRQHRKEELMAEIQKTEKTNVRSAPHLPASPPDETQPENLQSLDPIQIIRKVRRRLWNDDQE